MSYRTYLLVHTASAATPEAVRRFLDSQAEIVNWYTCLQNAYFVVTPLTVEQVVERFRAYSGGRGRFVVLDAQVERGGLLPRAAWDVIAKPTPADQPDVGRPGRAYNDPVGVE